MPEYKTFFLTLKSLVNIAIPLCFLLRNAKEYNWTENEWICYAFTLLFPLAAIIYIFAKKRIYHERYLYKPYVPSNAMIILVQICDMAMLSIFYHRVFFLKKVRNTATISWACFHLFLSIFIYLFILFKKDRTRKILSSAKHSYKLGILARDIGGKNGLVKGQPVEIVQVLEGGYLVKDNKNQNFELKREDFEEILDIV